VLLSRTLVSYHGCDIGTGESYVGNWDEEAGEGEDYCDSSFKKIEITKKCIPRCEDALKKTINHIYSGGQKSIPGRWIDARAQLLLSTATVRSRVLKYLHRGRS
jgi:hypothetical protein